MPKQSGFTLIELLVVISIIGLLSSIVLTSMNSSRMKARDTRRIADLGQIRLALELYFDSKGYYPNPGTCGYDCNSYSVSYAASWNSLATELAPYISILPKDPLNSGGCPPWETNCFSYSYGNVGRYLYPPTYDLTAQLEDTNNPRRCGIRNWKYYFYDSPWCTAFSGGYTNQIYEASFD